MYPFDIDGALFAENQCDDIHGAQLRAEITFNKNSSIMTFHFNISGTFNVTCDRCGEDFDMPTEIKRQLIVKTESREHLEDDDMVTLSGDEPNFDVAPYIYQYVVLSMPMQRIHPEKNGKSTCNSETIAKLNNIHVEKSNEEQYVLNSNKQLLSKEKTLKN